MRSDMAIDYHGIPVQSEIGTETVNESGAPEVPIKLTMPARKPAKATKPAPKKTNYQPFHW